MAKFAKYYIRYILDAFEPHQWEKRQQHLAALFKSDESIIFSTTQGEVQKVFNHRVYHLAVNPSIVVMQIANCIDIPIEKHYEQETTRDEPSCFVIIDNRSNLRTIAIQKRKKAFSGTQQVAKIMRRCISEKLYHDHCYLMEILPEYLPEDLFFAWEQLEAHATGMLFNHPEMRKEEIIKNIELLKQQHKPYFDDSLMGSMLEMDAALKEAGYKQLRTVLPNEAKSILHVDTTSRVMKNLLTLSSATNTPVDLKTKDGGTFRCFIENDEENTDKIMCGNYDSSLLEQLFSQRNKDGEKLDSCEIEKIESSIVELMNGMKHELKVDDEVRVEKGGKA